MQAKAAEHAKPYRELGPAVDLVGDTNYADFQCSLDDPPDLYNYWSADYHDELSDDALDIFIDSARNLPGPALPAADRPLGRCGGRATRSRLTRCMNRNANWVSHPFGIWVKHPKEGRRPRPG